MKMNKRWHITTLVAIGLLLISVANTFASEHSWAAVRESKWQGALIDIYFVDQQHGWIVGAQSTILHTSDGGQTWDNQPSQPLPFKNEFHKVRFINPQIGWIAGEEGTVLKTIDGGATWMKLSTGTRAALSTIFFVDDRHGWAGGDGGLIIQSTDGGMTWTRQETGTNNAIRSVQFANPQTGWAVGDAGTVVHKHYRWRA